MEPYFFSDFAEYRVELSRKMTTFCGSLPSALASAFLSFSGRYRWSKDSIVWPSIYFLLPYWIQRDLGCDVTNVCMEISYANACMSYVVLIQDHILDRDESDSGPLIMVSNALSLEAVRTFAAIFDKDSRFWSHHRNFLQDSWNESLMEREKRLSPQLALTLSEVRMQQAKVNTLKIAALAVALTVDHLQAMPQIVDYLNCWQMGCQAIDDFQDWEEDLQTSNYTRFLVTAGASSSEGGAEVERFIGSGGLISYLEEALSEYNRARGACLTGGKYLDGHIVFLIDQLKQYIAGFHAFAHLREALFDKPDTVEDNIFQ
jgi:hypothetical protein